MPLSLSALRASLYDGTAGGGSQTYSSLVLYPSYNQQIFTLTDLGKTWAVAGLAPWSYSIAARFGLDAENNLYFVGGQTLGDTWFSNSKGQSWSQMAAASTSTGYLNPVVLSSATDHCLFINYQSGSGLNGYHRQLTVFGGFLEVYNTKLKYSGTSAANNLTYGVCTCDSISGVRAMNADLIFPGESSLPNLNGGQTNSANGGGGGSTTFSQGQTAGIAIGVGVGVALLCLMAMFFLLAGRRSGKAGGEGAPVGGSHKQFNDEQSQMSTADNTEGAVEMASP